MEKRLTTARQWCDAKNDLENEFGYSHIWCRLNAIENILGDNYDLRHLRDLVQADMEGRCAVVPDGGYTDNDGKNALKSAMNTCYYHNNPVTRYIVDAVAEKLTREAAEEALKGEKHG